MGIHIFWDRGISQGLEIPVSRLITQILDLPVEPSSNPILYNGFERSREQFDAASILSSIDTFSRRNSLENPVLLVIGDDIFRPGTRYVFGLSRPRTGSAVISAARLRNEFWDLPPDDTLLIERLAKEGSHEVGHLLGLRHCTDPACIMSNPACLDDLDTKRTWLCGQCAELIKTPPLVPAEGADLS